MYGTLYTYIMMKGLETRILMTLALYAAASICILSVVMLGRAGVDEKRIDASS